MSGLDVDLRQVMIETDHRHSRDSRKSFAHYRQRRYEELKQFVTARRTVYLDMNFWISLRNPSESRRAKESMALLELLRGGVKSGSLLCPVSYHVFVELMKQKGPQRMAQAELMDELSQGIGIRSSFDVIEIEYLNFFAKYIPPINAMRIDHVWAPIGHLIHEVYPDYDELPHEFMERGRKVMCDVNWARKLTHLVSKDLPEFRRTAAAKINEARKIHLRHGRTFERLFAEELDGSLDERSEHIEEIIRQLARCVGINPEAADMSKDELRTFVNVLRNVATQVLDKEAIPSQRVEAALHAAMRLNDLRPFKENDLDDFRHASVAMAYCDVFLCDGPLAALLTNSKVRQVIPHHCKVISDFSSAIATLSET